MEVMSKDSSERIDNILLAELNNVAYKAIRTTGLAECYNEQ